MPRRIIAHHKGIPIYALSEGAHRVHRNITLFSTLDPIPTRKLQEKKVPQSPEVKQPERFYCGEGDCEQAWEGEEEALRPDMADHMVSEHGYDALKYGLRIKPPEESAVEEDDTEVEEADDTLPDPEDDRLPPDDAQVNLRYSSDTPSPGVPRRECGNCLHFEPPGGCALVLGVIREVDVCNLFEMSPEAKPGGHAMPGGAKESIRAFEAAYASDEFRIESATLPKAKNDADMNFSVNECVERLRSAGWYLADHSKEVAVFRHRKLPGHTLAVRGKRWEHREEDGTLIARQHPSRLADYAEAAPGLLSKLSEAVKAFARSYND